MSEYLAGILTTLLCATLVMAISDCHDMKSTAAVKRACGECVEPGKMCGDYICTKSGTWQD